MGDINQAEIAHLVFVADAEPRPFGQWRWSQGEQRLHQAGDAGPHTEPQGVHLLLSPGGSTEEEYSNRAHQEQCTARGQYCPQKYNDHHKLCDRIREN